MAFGMVYGGSLYSVYSIDTYHDAPNTVEKKSAQINIGKCQLQLAQKATAVIAI